MRSAILFSLFMFLVAGCTALEPSRINNEPFTISDTYRIPQQHAEPPRAKTSKVWRGQFASMFSDQRARSVGDIVTVKIVEVSQASEKATTDTTRKSETKAHITNFFGLETNPNGPWKNSSSLINAGMPNNDFSGSGETTRTGSLSATITARVMDVLPNGNLAIEGKRELYVNNEKKEILLQGVVRPKDIAYDNSILSTQIADAKVIYTGIGVLAEKQRPGWLARLLDYAWPF
ncbi:MAG: Flagellar L-ring protein precursor [Syntrophorhabdaceae bacterium PtaU1.Bin034]|jgi:flagellar L-ring protein precursor FlgH|nr:MAG: Flagellar L-ring protein precursor [Syntrophorhabdaceae bacterium PtaU1.Bin034]